MIRLFIFSLSLALFSGCFGQQDEPPVTMSEDPQVAFDEMSQKQRVALAESIMKLLPEMEQYKMSQSEMDISISAFIPEMGGDIEANITAMSESDTTDPENPEASTEISLSGKAMGELFSGDVSAIIDVVIADARMFARLREVNVDVPNIPVSQIMAPIEPIIEQWYGDTLDTINEGLGGELDLQEIMTQGAKGPAEIRAELGEIIKNADILAMKEQLENENGFARFSVSLDNEKLKEMLLDIVSLSNPSEAVLEDTKEQLDQDLEGFSMGGTIGYKIQNPEYFTFSGIAREAGAEGSTAEITISYMESTKTISFKEVAEGDKQAGHATLNISEENGTNMFEVVGGESAEENETLIKGESSKNNFTATIYDVEEGVEFAMITLEKEGGIWSGKITNTKNPDIVIRINHLVHDKTSFSLDITVAQEEETLGTGSVEYSIEEVNSVNIEAPEQYESFGVLMKNFLPLMMMGTPGAQPSMAPPPSSLPPAPEGMTDEEMQALFEEMMAEEGMEIDMDELKMEDTEGKVPEPPAFPAELTE